MLTMVKIKRVRNIKCLSWQNSIVDEIGVWHHLKHVGRPHLCCLNLAHLRAELGLGIGCLRHRPYVITAFFAEVGLAIEVYVWDATFCNLES